MFDELRAFKWQKNGDDFIALKEDGSRLEDKAGNAKTFNDIVTEIAKTNFAFKASTDKSAPGNGGAGAAGGTGGAAKKYTGPAPKTAEDYVKILTDQTLTADIKAEVKEAYGNQFA